MQVLAAASKLEGEHYVYGGEEAVHHRHSAFGQVLHYAHDNGWAVTNAWRFRRAQTGLQFYPIEKASVRAGTNIDLRKQIKKTLKGTVVPFQTVNAETLNPHLVSMNT